MFPSRPAKAGIRQGLAALFCAALLGSCTNQPQTNTTTKTTKEVTATTDSTKAIDTTLTLPALNALFAEDSFTGDLKAKLNLSTSQIERLKTVSAEAVADLSEDGPGDYSGSERTAIQRANRQIRSILGNDKANQLFQFVSERYAGGDIAGMMSTEPNSVPKDTRIVVNAPAYRMDVFQDGKLTKTYKVGIGYPEFPLPTGMRRAAMIIFNPTWTPPDEPWVKGKFKPGQKVDAGSKDNPLGPIKIPIGLPNLIHGGKQPAKLGGFASHGCVGLTNDGIRDFAGTLAQLSGSALTPDSIALLGQGKTETKNYKLAKTIPVELRYETIVAQPDGLHIFRDVYERGTNTVAAAGAVLKVYGVSVDALPANEKQSLLQALTQMNRDAQGKPIVDDPANSTATDSAAAANAAALDSGRKDGVAASKLARAKTGKTTATIVGQKEIVVPIAQLQGKGYPAPVNLYTGASGTATAAKHR